MSHIYVYPCRIADAFTSMFMTHTCQSWYTIVLFRHVKVHQRMHKLSRKKTKWAKIGPNHFLKTGGPIKDSKRGPHADLKFIATAATDGRLKFCQVCKFFQFLTYFVSLHTPDTNLVYKGMFHEKKLLFLSILSKLTKNALMKRSQKIWAGPRAA